MLRQSIRWSATKKLLFKLAGFDKFSRAVVIALLFFAGLPPYAAAETASTNMTPEQEQQYNDAKQSATSLGNDILDYLGTESGVEQNISAPMTSSGTKMHTLDNSQSFPAQLTSPASSGFLTIIAQPGSGGDLSVRVIQDTDLDNDADYDFTLPFRISGVCGNGVISCDAGTWNNCRYYLWKTNSNDKLTLEAGSMSNRLGGCYCINNSCGGNLAWNNLQAVLESLGGSASGAIMQNRPHYVITKVTIDGPTIIYW